MVFMFVFQLIGTNLRGEMTVQQAETVELSIIGKLAKTMKISSDDVCNQITITLMMT